MSAGGLFEIPEQPAVHPVKLSPGHGEITYSEVSKRLRMCTDCNAAQLEHATGDFWAQPLKPVLPATVRRKQGGRVAYLCEQHANLRREHDEQNRSDSGDE